MRILGLTLMMAVMIASPVFAGTLNVSKVEGETLFLQPGEKEWQKLQPGVFLALGDRVSTAEEAVAQFESSSGILEMSENTYIWLKTMPSGSTGGFFGLELAYGMLKAKCLSGAGDVTLEIQTPNGTVTSSGFISLWIYSLLGKMYTRLDVFEGGAHVRETKSGREKTLSAGQHITFGEHSDFAAKEEPFVRGFNAFQIEPAAQDSETQAHVLPSGSDLSRIELRKT